MTFSNESNFICRQIEIRECQNGEIFFTPIERRETDWERNEPKCDENKCSGLCTILFARNLRSFISLNFSRKQNEVAFTKSNWFLLHFDAFHRISCWPKHVLVQWNPVLNLVWTLHKSTDKQREVKIPSDHWHNTWSWKSNKWTGRDTRIAQRARFCQIFY